MNEEKMVLASAIMDVVSEGMVIVNPLGQILTANRAALEMSGYEEGEVVGAPVVAFIKKGERLGASLVLREVLRNGEICNYEATIVTKAGNEVPVSISARGIGNENVRVVLVFRDISKIKTFQSNAIEAIRKHVNMGKQSAAIVEEYKALLSPVKGVSFGKAVRPLKRTRRRR